MNEYLKESDFYKTSDLNLAAAFQCYGYCIDAVDKQNPAKVVFLIKRDEQLDDLIQMYFTHQLQVEPIAFANALKEIKTRIYNT